VPIKSLNFSSSVSKQSEQCLGSRCARAIPRLLPVLNFYFIINRMFYTYFSFAGGLCTPSPSRFSLLGRFCGGLSQISLWGGLRESKGWREERQGVSEINVSRRFTLAPCALSSPISRCNANRYFLCALCIMYIASVL